MKSFAILLLLGFLLAQCSRKNETGPARDPLAAELWQKLLLVEENASFSEILPADLAAQQQNDIAILRDKIPAAYPEPYLPYGRLSDPRIDFKLSRAPFLNADIVALGKKLFFDTRLSFSQSHAGPGDISCSSCHLEDKSFADPRPLSVGVEGDPTPRNAPTIFNVAYLSTLTWANPIFPALEMQAKIPLFGDDPVEMGQRGRESKIFSDVLLKDADYAAAFSTIFPGGAPDYTMITSAIAAYERSLIRFDTKFDRFLQGKTSLETDEAEGLRFFYGIKPLASGDSLPCAQCHAGILLTNSYQYVREGRFVHRQSFHNTGLYNLDGKGAYPEKNHGYANAEEIEEKPELMGRFRVPPLRFVGTTAPYGHDGSLESLEAVIRHYAAGGRASLTEKGQNPYIDELVKPGFRISEAEIAQLVTFLKTLD